jgi:proteasome beta subunit
MDAEAAVHVAESSSAASYSASTATGGPDTVRGIFPVVATVTADGYRRVEDAEISRVAEQIVAQRRERGHLA